MLPLYEFVGSNWRAERSSLETVLGYAHPARDLLQFALPNVYGNPAHTSYLDVFSGAQVSDLRNAAGQPIDRITWGIKNYVEGALYLGLLPLILALYALVRGSPPPGCATNPALLRAPEPTRADLHVRLAHLPPDFRPARHESTQLALPLGLRAEFRHRCAGWLRSALPQ